MVPGAAPFRELAAGLGASGPPVDTSAVEAAERSGDLTTLLAGALADGETRLLLVIDHLEQLFVRVNGETRSRFLSGLVAALAASQTRLLVIATLRADFLHVPLGLADVGELVRSGTELVTPLTRTELERAIARPADAVGVEVEPGLVAEMINEVEHRPGVLPLLQYALTELFDRSDGRRLTREGYAAIGGATAALGRRAEEAWRSLDAMEREVAQQVLLRLVAANDGGVATIRLKLGARAMDAYGFEADWAWAAVRAAGSPCDDLPGAKRTQRTFPDHLRQMSERRGPGRPEEDWTMPPSRNADDCEATRMNGHGRLPRTFVGLVALSMLAGCASGASMAPSSAPTSASATPAAVATSPAMPTPAAAPATPTIAPSAAAATVPVTATPVVSPDATVTSVAGTATCPTVDSGSATTVSDGYQEFRGGTLTCIVTTGDARVSGTEMASPWNENMWGKTDSVAMVQWGTLRLENAGGAWEGTGSGVYSSDRGDIVVSWYKGTGGYTGLGYFELRTGKEPNMIQGLIFPGDPPKLTGLPIVTGAAPSPNVPVIPTPAPRPTPEAIAYGPVTAVEGTSGYTYVDLVGGTYAGNETVNDPRVSGTFLAPSWTMNMWGATSDSLGAGTQWGPSRTRERRRSVGGRRLGHLRRRRGRHRHLVQGFRGQRRAGLLRAPCEERPVHPDRGGGDHGGVRPGLPRQPPDTVDPWAFDDLLRFPAGRRPLAGCKAIAKPGAGAFRADIGSMAARTTQGGSDHEDTQLQLSAHCLRDLAGRRHGSPDRGDDAGDDEQDPVQRDLHPGRRPRFRG